MENVYVPCCVGVPVNEVLIPVPPSVRPGGRLPDATAHVMAPTPPPNGPPAPVEHAPVVVSVWLYTAPICPFGRDVVVIANVPAPAAAIVPVKGTLADAPF